MTATPETKKPLRYSLANAMAARTGRSLQAAGGNEPEATASHERKFSLASAMKEKFGEDRRR